MKTTSEIMSLLDELDNGKIADDLERQDLDFKEWIQRSFDDNIKLMIKWLFVWLTAVAEVLFWCC